MKAYKNEAAILVSVDDDGAPGQPLVIPDALGDTPLIVEMMSAA